MPLYDYQCECGHFRENVYHSMFSTEPQLCPGCSRAMTKVPSLPHTDLREFHKPIEMYSVALDTDADIAEFKRRCPDVDVATDPADPMYGIPIARSRKQKLAALKAAGFVEAK